jgi:asparagine synthase (glutamine-hydrolysing)
MCGIAGYININSRPVHDTSSILNMLRVQRHRGPDDSGIRAFSLNSGQSVELRSDQTQTIEDQFEGILGFNRLSILDLSERGHQPMTSPDGRVLLAFNGEIYNAFTYKEELEKWGYVFKSTTDTEIILALYLKYGLEATLSRLNGMFAIVFVDLNKQDIFIARDRFGIKPMYFMNSGKMLAFSSELKSFRFLDNFVYTLAEDQIDEYLIFRNNLNGTLFKGVESLEPGHYLSLSHGKVPVIRRYFNIDQYSRSIKSNEGIDFYHERLEEWLRKSVKDQLMSDVKLGCQLSGGIDSSLVTWLASNNIGSQRLETVSIILKDKQLSEEKYITMVTDHLKITSYKFLLDSDYFSDNIEKATWHFEAPLEHSSNVALFMLAQEAKKYVTVLLSGEGSDEIFGGYKRYYDIRYPFKSKKLLHEIKKSLRHPTDLIKYLYDANRAVMATAYLSPWTAAILYPKFNEADATRKRLLLYETLTGSLFDRQVKYELKTYLPDLLLCQDKMSMAHSIENRVPFVDNEILDHSFTIPEEYLLPWKSPEGFNTQKYLLKKTVARALGNEFAFREKKGFDMPVREFLSNKKTSDYFHDKIFPGIKARQLFNYKLILDWSADIGNIRRDQLEALWIAVAFEIWASIFLDN